jgi:hypothetical protein
MKTMHRRLVYLSITLFIALLSGGWVQAEQNKFWTMETGNYWDYLDSPSDSWPAREQVTLDTATFPFSTYLFATTEYQGSAWVPLDNRWFEIRETGPSASELRLWQITSYEDLDRVWIAHTFDSGLIWAKRPMMVGDSWTSSTSGTYIEGTDTGPFNITVNSVVLSYESVEVPFGNGTYNAYKISHSIQIAGLSPITENIWVVPYLGIIKSDSVDEEGYEADYLSAMDIATVFTDALYDHWAYPYIMQIYDEGITLGYGDGRYGPDDPVTREQMAVFILKALNDVPADGYCGTTAPFTDVLPDRWSCKYIKRLYELGITSGYQDGRFGPVDPVTREQMAVFITRALDQVPADGYCGTTSPFSDVLYSWWSCKYVKMLSELHITSGYGDGRYGPGDPITRAQMAVFLSRAFLGRQA